MAGNGEGSQGLAQRLVHCRSWLSPQEPSDAGGVVVQSEGCDSFPQTLLKYVTSFEPPD